MDIKRFNGKIYSIRSYQTDLIYIGSTCETRLSARLSKHRGQYNYYNNGKGKGSYYSSYEILKFNDAYIELIEEVKDKTKDELHKLEGEHIRNNKCVNINITGRTQKEYHKVNRDKILELKKEYYEYNKIKILEQQNKKYTCECGKSLSTGNKPRHLKVCKATVIC